MSNNHIRQKSIYNTYIYSMAKDKFLKIAEGLIQISKRGLWKKLKNNKLEALEGLYHSTVSNFADLCFKLEIETFPLIIVRFLVCVCQNH